jgi:hypothetical protein
MTRREFITLLGGAAAAWPLEVKAQQGERLRRIGILMPYPPTDTEYQSRMAVLLQELQRLGWTRGGNIEFDERWTMDNMDLVRANAVNLVELKPDVIVAVGGRAITILLQITRAIPIVVPGAIDPVGMGWVKSLARPGGNITGFTLLEFSMFSKLLDLPEAACAGPRSALGWCSIPTIRTVLHTGTKSRALQASSGLSPSSSRFTILPTSIARLPSSQNSPIRPSISCRTSPPKRWLSRSSRSFNGGACPRSIATPFISQPAA